MRHVARHYEVVPIEDVLQVLDDGPRLPRRAVLLTFDDGYTDFAEYAWPILKKYGLPATLFVPTAYPDRPERSFWWDRVFSAVTRTKLQSASIAPFGPLALTSTAARRGTARRLFDYLKDIPQADAMALVDRIYDSLGGDEVPLPSVLGWNELRRLARDGVTLAAHSRNHPLLTAVGTEEARVEIRGSQRDLERETGRALPVFCYPAGAFDERIVEIARAEGIRLAFTTLDGHNKIGRTNPLALYRTAITPRTTLPIFRLRLFRAVSYLDRWRKRSRAKGA